MGRWRIPDTGLARAPQGVHFALAVGLPTGFVHASVYMLTGEGPSWPLAPLGLLYAAVLALWAPWRLHTRQGLALKAWFWVVPTLALWAAMTLAGSSLLWFGVAFVQGQLAVLWAGQLASRARLFRLLEGVPEGLELEEKFRDLQLDANFSRGNHAALSSSLVVLAALAVGFAAVSPVRGPGPGLVLAVLLMGCSSWASSCASTAAKWLPSFTGTDTPGPTSSPLWAGPCSWR